MHVQKKKEKFDYENNGEEIYELLGENFPEKAEKHSVAYVIIKRGSSSTCHYHEIAEESYYILRGKARIQVGGYNKIVNPGEIILVPTGKKHQIENIGDGDLEFLVICVPPWTEGDMH